MLDTIVCPSKTVVAYLENVEFKSQQLHNKHI